MNAGGRELREENEVYPVGRSFDGYFPVFVCIRRDEMGFCGCKVPISAKDAIKVINCPSPFVFNHVTGNFNVGGEGGEWRSFPSKASNA